MFNNKRLLDKIKTKFMRIDIKLLVVVYTLVAISTLFVYSATRNMYFVYQNIMWIIAGTFFVFISFFIDYKITKKYIWYLYGMGISVLLIVRFFGKKTLGAQRWLRIGKIQLQPSEFVKIIVILVISYWIVKKFKNGINNIKDIIVAFLPTIPLILLILLQPDLGTTLILCFSFFCILYLYNANMKPVFFMILLGLVLSVPIYTFVLKDYQKTRVEIFLNPEKDVRGSGWHVTQSKISIGSGEWTGTGILKGMQSRLKFLPEPQTDFIFSVIAEETGFFGATFVLSLYFALIYFILKISKVVNDNYGRIILYGIAGIFLAHVIINVGMTLGLVPVTGKPLLFMSYGGSSFLSSFMMIGLVESIKIHSE